MTATTPIVLARHRVRPLLLLPPLRQAPASFASTNSAAIATPITSSVTTIAPFSAAGAAAKSSSASTVTSFTFTASSQSQCGSFI